MSRTNRNTEPYRVLLATKLPRELDRRVRLSDNDKDDIRARYKKGETRRGIARAYEDKCSRGAIQYTVHPEKYARMLKGAKERRIDGRYKPSKKDWNETMKEHRHYKKKVLIATAVRVYNTV